MARESTHARASAAIARWCRSIRWDCIDTIVQSRYQHVSGVITTDTANVLDASRSDSGTRARSGIEPDISLAFSFRGEPLTPTVRRAHVPGPALSARIIALMASGPRELPIWCVVQADGDKAYLTPSGAVPVQYFNRTASLWPIQRSLDRALSITSRRRIVATVAEAHRKWWSYPLWCVAPQRRVVDQFPTRPTVTLAAALAVVERTAQDATLILQPADTFRAGGRAFIAGVRRAVRALEALPGSIVTLTVGACASEPGQDYLLLGADDALPGRTVLRFLRRPQKGLAEHLIEIGACVSTGVYVARLSMLTSLLAQRWPGLMAAARSLAAGENPGEISTPARMDSACFYRPRRYTWVQRPLQRLRALAVDDIGWSSLGEPNFNEELAARCSLDIPHAHGPKSARRSDPSLPF